MFDVTLYCAANTMQADNDKCIAAHKMYGVDDIVLSVADNMCGVANIMRIILENLCEKTFSYIRKKHKRNEEGDQGGPWTPLEGPKIDFRRSQNLPNYSVFRLNAESLFSQKNNFIYPSNQVAQTVIIDVFGSSKGRN